MSNKLFVGNLSWNVGERRLLEVFARHGEVEEARVMKDDRSGVSRGFGFVTMESAEGATKAREALHGTKLEGNDLIVDAAKS